MNGDQAPIDSAREPPTDPIAVGDAAAEANRWPQAVAAWQSALTSSRRAEAIERLQWFVSWRSGRTPAGPSVSPRRPSALPPLLIGAGSGVAATALVFLADGRSGSLQTVLVVAAWLLYGAAAVLSLVYAARTGHRRHGVHVKLRRREASRLCADATRLARTEVPAVAPVIHEQRLGTEGSGP